MSCVLVFALRDCVTEPLFGVTEAYETVLSFVAEKELPVGWICGVGEGVGVGGLATYAYT